MTNLDSILKTRYYFANKGLSGQSCGFSNSHGMWELDYKESWAPKNWCFWNVVLEKTLKSPLDWKEMKSVYPKGNQSWIFIGKTDAEAETPILWPPDVKKWLSWKDPDIGKDWRQEEKRTIEGEILDSITNSWSLPKPLSIAVGDAIQSSHPLSSTSPPTLNLSQHKGFFQ